MEKTNRVAKQRMGEDCPACNCKLGHSLGGQLWECSKCRAIFGTCYLGDSYGRVLPYFAKAPVAPERLRYYDFTCLGSKGITRRHGWYDPETRLVHQVG